MQQNQHGSSPAGTPAANPVPGTGGGPKMTRRQFLKRGAATVIGAAALSGGYAWQAEPRWLEVTRHTVKVAGLPSGFDGIKVIHFSDTHLGFHKDASDLSGLIAGIKREQPDLICFTGDIVDSEPRDARPAVPLLAELTAPLGKYAVLGNHDYKNAPALAGLLESAGFRVLRNASARIRRGGGEMAVAGIEDMLHGRPDPEAALSDVPKGMCTLLLMHEPDYADTAAAYPFHLQLSGHSHGGQIRLPFVGAPYTPYGAQKYVAGLYHVGQRGMPLYVNRGFGMTYMPFRFLCRPELSVLTLRKG